MSVSSLTSLVTLKDDSKVPVSTLQTVANSLKALNETNGIALYDLFQICRDPNYKPKATPMGDSTTILKKFSLMESDGRI